MIEDRESLEQIGREILGPAFCLHLHLTALFAARHRIDRLYFLARDGHLMKELYPLFSDLAGGHSPSLHYLHVSRRSTVLAAVQRLGPRESVAQKSLGDVLRELALADDEIQATLSLLGYREVEQSVVAPDRNLRLHQLLDDPTFRRLVEKHTSAARRLLKKYLHEQQFLEGGRVGLIDVGWSGTIQDHLTRSLRDEKGRPELFGIYLGFLPSPEAAKSHSKEEKTGTVFDHRRAATLLERSPLHLVELFEQGGRANEGTTLSYTEKEGEVRPVFLEHGVARAAERAAWPAVSALQAGIRSAADQYVRDARVTDSSSLSEVRRVVQQRLERFIFLPTPSEIEAMSALVHCENEERHTSLAPSPHGAALFSPRRFMKGFYRSPWKPAYLAQTLGRPACHLFRSYERAKLRS